MKRRAFIRDASLTLAGVGLLPGAAFPIGNSQEPQLTILHTNDVHSRLDPFPANAGSMAGLGGAARRAALVQQIRATEEHVLLLDAGDMLQGTPYFNFFDGKPEFQAMQAMRYDAATLGNHDFDGGLGLLQRRLPELGFPILCTNYQFRNALLGEWIKPWQVFERGSIRIGVYGLGIRLDGLVPANLHDGTLYLDPVEAANNAAHHLRHAMNCHFVICLSHLGYAYRDGRISDQTLASRIRGTDLIIGGHTHTLLERPMIQTDMDGCPIRIAQVGWGGAWLGRIDVRFSRRLRWKHISGSCHLVDK